MPIFIFEIFFILLNWLVCLFEIQRIQINVTIRTDNVSSTHSIRQFNKLYGCSEKLNITVKRNYIRQNSIDAV